MTVIQKRKKVIEEVKKIPDNLVDAVYTYLKTIRSRKKRIKKKDIIETALASELILAKDWLKKEEDEAWKDL